jgi:hypothetical protein
MDITKLQRFKSFIIFKSNFSEQRNGKGDEVVPEICKKLTFMRNPKNFAKQVNEFLTKSWAAVNNEKGRIIPSVIRVPQRPHF